MSQPQKSLDDLVSKPVSDPRLGPDFRLPSGPFSLESQCVILGCVAYCDILLALLGTLTFQIWTRSFADLAIDDFSLWQRTRYSTDNGQTLRSSLVCPLLDCSLSCSTVDRIRQGKFKKISTIFYVKSKLSKDK